MHKVPKRKMLNQEWFRIHESNLRLSMDYSIIVFYGKKNEIAKGQLISE